MRELSLFSGAGGGLLATKYLLGWTTVGYVEIDDYCQRVIAQRIKDGYLDDAPIFGDIRAFIRDGYAESYQGMVDVISAGFPCQPFSQCGRRLGADDERNLWPFTRDVLAMVRPRFAFLENVPGLLADPYFETIITDMATLGLCVRWTLLSVKDLGATQQRERLWILAYAESKQMGRTGFARAQAVGSLEHAHDARLEGRKREGKQDAARTKRQTPCSEFVRPASGLWPPGPKKESEIPRMVDGVAHRMDRLRAIGNGQVPAVAATAWRLLTEAEDATLPA